MARQLEQAGSQNGFTLIELLVAISLLAIISVLAWKGLDQTLLGRRHITDNMQEERSLLLAFEQIRQDLAETAVDVRLPRPVLQVRGDTLSLVRWSLLPDAAPQLWRVDYRIRQGRLLREARRIEPSAGLGPTWQRQLWLQDLDAISAHVYQPGHGWTGTELAAGLPPGPTRLLRLQVSRPGWPWPVTRIYRIGP